MKPAAPPTNPSNRSAPGWTERHPALMFALMIAAVFAVAGGLALLFGATDRCPPGNGAPATITTRDFAGRQVVYVPRGC